VVRVLAARMAAGRRIRRARQPHPPRKRWVSGGSGSAERGASAGTVLSSTIRPEPDITMMPSTSAAGALVAAKAQAFHAADLSVNEGFYKKNEWADFR